MSEVDLATLSGPELRRLLDATRARGQASLSYLILQEMQSRRDGSGRRRSRLGGRKGEARTIDLDFGEPAEGEDDLPPAPLWRPPARDAEATPAAQGEPQHPPSAPSPTLDPPASEFELARARRGAPRPRRRGLLAATSGGFAAGVAASAAFAWSVGALDVSRLDVSELGAIARFEQAPEAQAAPPVVKAAAAPPASLEVEFAPDLTAEAPLQPEPEDAPPVDPGELALASPDAEAPVPEPPAVAPAPAPRVETSADPCGDQPTPADRAICADPALKDLQRSLQRAYARALDAHEDRALLRQRQLAWRDARSPISDPAELARIYEERITRLNGAAQAARRARGAD